MSPVVTLARLLEIVSAHNSGQPRPPADPGASVPDRIPADEAVAIGVDFGTLSGRAVVVRVRDGEELGDAVHEYRHGVVDGSLPGGGRILPPDWALQVPEDWRDVLRLAVPAAMAAAGVSGDQVIGIG